MSSKKYASFFTLILLVFAVLATASTFIDNDDSDFNLGTHNFTFYNSSGFVQLNSSRLNGTFTSQVFNAGSSSHWNNLSWVSNAIGEMPSNQGNEISLNTFGNGNINMTENILLMHMNEASGTIIDSSGMGNNGTQFGGVAYSASAKLGTGFNFDGVDDRANISASTNFVFGTGNFSISHWVYVAQSADVQSNAGLLSQYNGGGWFTELKPSGVNTYGFYDGTGHKDSGVTIKYGEWVHFAIVREGTGTNQAKMYIDGKDVYQWTMSFDIVANNNLWIGVIDYSTYPTSYRFNGTIDELAVWNRSLSASEILNIYKRGALKLNLSVQSCDDASCSGESFTNLGNNLTSPQNLSVTNNTYFQYKFDFATDNVSYTPEFYNITIDYTLLNQAPTVTLNSISNNSYQNAVSSVLLNATVHDLDLNNMTIWFYGGYPNGTYNLINITYNQTNGTSITYNWTGLSSLGQHNWTVIANDGTANSTNEYFFFNLINLTVNCEVGGGYQQNALVLVQGNVTDGVSVLSSNYVNVSIYNSNNILNDSKNLTTASDGSFETTFSGLTVGSYTLNATSSYQGFNKTCTDSFVVGSSADFVLDKIVSLYNMTNITITYNITLRTINTGGSSATSATLTDSDSSSSPYNLGNIPANSSIIKSYLKEYTRNSTTYNSTLAIAAVNATDSYSGNQISVNSTQITLTIPDSPTGQQLTLIKNAHYNSENSTAVNYTLTVEVVNSGGTDLTSISLIDTDLNINTNINLNRTQNSTSSGSVIVSKAASNTVKTFVKASATVNSVAYQSNQIQVSIPGYGGPADTIVYAPVSVSASTSFSSTIEIINQNSGIGQNFVVDYWITSNDESVNYSSGQQTIYVSASGSANLTATLTSPSSAGTYRLRALTSYIGGPDLAFDSFEVTALSSSSTSGGSSSSGSGGSLTGNVADEIFCNSLYMRQGTSCCLDVDSNLICDADEVLERPQENDNSTDDTSDLGDFKEESQFFKSIGAWASKLGSLFSSIGKKTSSNKAYLIVFFGVPIFIIILIFLIKNALKRKLKDMTRLNSIIGKEVYAEDGNKIGKIKEVFLENNHIYGWLIKPNNIISRKMRRKLILIKHKYVKSIGEIMIIEKGITEYIEK